MGRDRVLNIIKIGLCINGKFMKIPLEKLSVSDLGLSVRCEGAIRRVGIICHEKGSVLELIKKDLTNLMRVSGFGPVSRNELVKKLHEIGLSMNDKNLVQSFEELKNEFYKIENKIYVISKEMEKYRVNSDLISTEDASRMYD